MQIIIDPEFQSQIPPQSPEEKAALEASIRAEGCRDPLTVWGSILIDGHHRHAICSKHGIEYQTVSRDFADREAVAIWIDENQLSRRNLSREQMSLIRGRQYNRLKKQGERSDLTLGQNDTKLNSAESLSAQYGVSERTIKRDGAKAAGKVFTPKPPKVKPETVTIPKERFDEIMSVIDYLTNEQPSRQHALEYGPMTEEQWQEAMDKCNEWAVTNGYPPLTDEQRQQPAHRRI